MSRVEGSVKSAVALIDGEHYPDVTISTLEFVEDVKGYRLVALVFLGGTEKLPDPEKLSYKSLPVYMGAGEIKELRRALVENNADTVIDLSDEPVLDYRRRFRLICEALSLGVDYRGSDFYFKAPVRPFLCDKPSIGIWGTGKRVGKTAISGYTARYLNSKGTATCVLTMGRGGPEEPELLSKPEEVDDAFLNERVKEGRHAASDHFEEAMMGGMVAVGCRRCGGGLAGEPYYSNVAEGAALACARECEILLLEGSGAAIPPAGADAVLLTASALQPPESILGYLGPYRLLLSDVVVMTMCEDYMITPEAIGEIEEGILAINDRLHIVKTVFRPRPLGNIEGKKVYLATTAGNSGAKVQADYLENKYGAEVIGYSPDLADRKKLGRDLEQSAAAEVLVTELKAAAVDTVSRFALENGKELIYIDNVPVSTGGDLDSRIDLLEAIAKNRSLERKMNVIG